MTANWAKRRNAHYPYYLCNTKGCVSYGKSVKRAELEGAFEAMLHKLTPAQEAVQLTRDMLRKVWEQRSASFKEQAAAQRQELATVEHKLEQLLDRIVEANDTSLVATYESRLRTLEHSRIAITEKTANCGRPLQDFDDAFRTALDFLENPQKLWNSGHIEDKRMVCRLVFSGKVSYARNKGFRTAPIALPIRVLQGLDGSEKEMVGDTGIEPVTPSMSTKCSPAELIARCLERRGRFIVSGRRWQGHPKPGPQRQAGCGRRTKPVGRPLREGCGRLPAPVRANGTVWTEFWRCGWRLSSARSARPRQTR
jgi:site-specific DNA recombinase